MARLLPLVLLMASCASIRVPIEGCACSVSRHPVARDYERANTVFVGKVVSINPAPVFENPPRMNKPRVLAVHVKVLSQYKGEALEQATLYVDTYWVCAYPFVDGETYLIYAWNEHRFKNRLTTTGCVRTVLYADAGNDIGKLWILKSMEARK